MEHKTTFLCEGTVYTVKHDALGRAVYRDDVSPRWHRADDTLRHTVGYSFFCHLLAKAVDKIS